LGSQNGVRERCLPATARLQLEKTHEWRAATAGKKAWPLHLRSRGDTGAAVLHSSLRWRKGSQRPWGLFLGMEQSRPPTGQALSGVLAMRGQQEGQQLPHPATCREPCSAGCSACPGEASEGLARRKAMAAASILKVTMFTSVQLGILRCCLDQFCP